MLLIPHNPADIIPLIAIVFLAPICMAIENGYKKFKSWMTDRKLFDERKIYD